MTFGQHDIYCELSALVAFAAVARKWMMDRFMDAGRHHGFSGLGNTLTLDCEKIIPGSCRMSKV